MGLTIQALGLGGKSSGILLKDKFYEQEHHTKI